MMTSLAHLLSRSCLAAFLAVGLAAQEGQAPKKIWVEKPEVDLGTHLEGEVAHGRWDFRNPMDEIRHLKHFQPSCTCTRAEIHIGDSTYVLENEPKPNTIYRIREVDGVSEKQQVELIPLDPGQEGHVEFHIDLRGVNGQKEATLMVHTDDKETPFLALKAKALATQFFLVVPPEINLNKMSWKDERKFSARITSPIQPEFNLLEVVGELPDKMKVEFRKEERNGTSLWLIDGTYGPNVDPRSGGGVITFRTDVQGRTVDLRVMAFVEGPLQVRPGGFVPFGMIRHGQGGEKVVEFEPSDDFDLQIEKVEFKNLTIDASMISHEIVKEGKVVKLIIRVSKDAPRRLVRGDIEVHLNHPSAAMQELQFNGFVR